MIEEQRKKLEHIKNYFREGTYNILSKIQWDEFSRDLSNCGANFLKEIEQKRDETRKLEINFIFFRKRKQLVKLNSDYDGIAKDFDLFFDAGMRWLRSIIEGDKYAEYQILQRKYFEGLLSHCRQALDYLGNLISSKRNNYCHYQMVFWAVLAVFIASLSIALSIIFRIWT